MFLPSLERRGSGAAEEYVKSIWKADFTYFLSAENKARFGDYYSKSKWIKSISNDNSQLM